MKNLLITNTKFNNLVSELKNVNNCEILIIKKNLKDLLKKKTRQFSKVILITEKILPRNSEVYKIISKFIRDEKSTFIEIGHKKSEVPKEKACSMALISGSGNKTMIILNKLIEK